MSAAAPIRCSTASSRSVAKYRSAIMPTKNGEIIADTAVVPYASPDCAPESRSVSASHVPIVTYHAPQTKYWRNIITDRRRRTLEAGITNHAPMSTRRHDDDSRGQPRRRTPRDSRRRTSQTRAAARDRGAIAGDRRIDVSHDIREGVGPALLVTAWQADVGPRRRSDERRILGQQIVGVMTCADPQLVLLLLCPANRSAAPVHLEPQAVLVTRAHLADREDTARAAGKPQKDGAEILALNRHALAAVLRTRKRFRRCPRPNARGDDGGQVCKD